MSKKYEFEDTLEDEYRRIRRRRNEIYIFEDLGGLIIENKRQTGFQAVEKRKIGFSGPDLVGEDLLTEEEVETWHDPTGKE